MEWLKKLSNAIEYIESHLDTEDFALYLLW